MLWTTQPASCPHLILVLSVLKARYLLESAAEIGKFQRLILPLNRRIEGPSWYLNERLTQVLGCHQLINRNQLTH